MNQGWIKLHRTLMDWEWYDDIITRGIFIHCLLRANHTDANWRGMELKRGQFVTSLKHLADENGVSVQTLRTHLKRLKSTSELTIKSTNKYSIITVCKYASYQSEKAEANKQTNKQTNKQVTSNQHATNNQVTTDKNNNNNKNNQNDKNFFNETKKIEKTPIEIENEMRQYYNENTSAKHELFFVVEKSCGKTLTMDEKKAIAARITVFANDYALRPNWDSQEPLEKKTIRFTNYIINSIRNGYQLTNNNNKQQHTTEKKGYRVSAEFEKLLDEMAAAPKFGESITDRTNNPFASNTAEKMAGFIN